ncbi:phosphoribosylglycinamide formyltransferase [Achromatium sp. WMS2]|nr:phosphoribosylglycinamide formyltransferase [Achromatium sp. WMS2]
MIQHPLPIVVLISGTGSNLKAIIEQTIARNLPIVIQGVISNEPNALGLKTAHQAGIATYVLNHRDFSNRAAYDLALDALISKINPKLVVLAGFMRILTTDLVNRYRGRMLNIHPSLLPKYPGLNTHARVLAAGDNEHGASVHFVTPDLDAGPVIMQSRVPVLNADNAASLAARVLATEHKIYPIAILWFAQQRLRLENQGVIFDNQVLTQPILWPIVT